MNPVRTFTTALWAFGALFSANTALCQDYVYAAGDPNFSVNIPVENGYINVANGNLHLEFSLSNLKQRGALQLDEKLVYDSRIWKIVAYDNHYWWPINIPNTNSGWRFVKGNEVGTLGENLGSSTQQCYDPDTGDSSVTTTTSYTWTDPQGTEHDFDGYWTITSGTGYCYSPPNPESAAFTSEDGSGYSIILSGDDSSEPTVSVVDNQGTQVYPYVMDRYGNYFSTDSNGNLVDDLGRTPVIVTQNGEVTYYDVLTIGGARKRYTVTWGSFPVSTAFSEGGVAEWSGTINNAVTDIQLPDGSLYRFGYDFGTSPGAYGELTSMTLPTGGTVNYIWGNFFDSYQNVNRWLGQHISGGGTMWFSPSVITQCSSGGTGCQEQDFVGGIGRGETYQLTLNNGAWNTTTTTSGLVTIANTYDFSHPCSTCTGSMYINKSLETTALLDTHVVAQRQYIYASPQSGLVTADKEWDYYPYSGTIPTLPPTSTPTRETDYNYTYNNGWLLQSQYLYDLNGAQAAGTSYTYTGNPTATSGIPQHMVTSGPYLSSVSEWLNSSNSLVSTSYQLYDTGMVQSTTDADNNPPTTYGYDPSGTFVTSVTRPTTNGVNHISQSSYDFSSGLITQETDENSQSIGHTYFTSASDPNLGRPYQVSYPDGGVKTYSYPSSTEVDTVTAENGSTTISSAHVVDSFGRASQTVQGGISSETSYDGANRVDCITTKHVSVSSSTDGSTCYSYDELSRATSVAQPDASTVQYQYVGSTVTKTDEFGHPKKYQYDAFHQLKSMWEPDSSGALSLETDYFHDALGNVTCVQQQGGVGGSGCSNGSPSPGSSAWRTRWYKFDWLSRLVEAYTPESGYTCYGTTGGAAPNWTNCMSGYDGNGNLLHKTDARGVQTDFSYDYLNRVSMKSYSYAPAGSLPSCYAYDTAVNGKGRLAAEWTTTTGSCSSTAGYRAMRTFLAYDPMGRLWNEQQCVLGHCTTGTSTPACQTGTVYGLAYCYDLAGHQTFGTNGFNSPYYQGGSGSIAFTNTYDGAGRLASLTSNWNDSQHPAGLFTADPNTGYAPPGGLQHYTLGNNINVTDIYDKRLRPTGETATVP